MAAERARQDAQRLPVAGPGSGRRVPAQGVHAAATSRGVAGEPVSLPGSGAVVTSPAGLLALGHAAGNAAVSRSLSLQRNGDPARAVPKQDAAPALLDVSSLMELEAHGVVLDPTDQQTLARSFDHGFTLHERPDMILTLWSDSGLAMARVAALEVVAPAPLAPATEAYIFHIGKGRSVLLSSIGGGSVMLDAGSGTTVSGNSAAVRRLVTAVRAVTAGPAAVPSKIQISHPDADHTNAVRSLLSAAGFGATAVEVAAEQLRSTGAFTRANLTVRPGQRLVEIEVVAGAAGSVHVRRTVVDNLELTEFRSVAAHRDAAGGGTRYNRNRTSPVTVVTDLVTGERSIYTADAEGRQFTEIVDQIGERALRRLLGADARNLRLVELPHHGGAQTGPDAAGLLRMLQLAFESSDGSLRLVTQTSTSFAAKPSSSIRFLDEAGVPAERIGSTGTAPGATRARGSALAEVTVDQSGVRQVLDVARANEATLQQAYGRLAEIRALRAEAGSLAEGLARAQAPASLLASAQATHAALVERENTLRGHAAAVWTAMQTAASGAAGMRGSRDVSGVTAALGTLTAQTRSADPAVSAADLDAHRAGLTAYARLYVNAVAMVAALEAERFQDLHKLKSEHRQLLRAVRGVLGAQTVSEHVRGAWDATKAHWTTDRIEQLTETLTRRVVHRRVNTEFRAVLAESLARQMQLNELAERAMQGGRQVYGPGGRAVTPGRTRVGAGILAAIEVVRIGLEVADSARAASEAAEIEEVRQSWEGITTLNWWLRRGVLPEVALVKRGWFSGRFDVVSGAMTQAAILAAARSEKRPEGVPEFDKVVVTRLDAGELRRMVMAQVVTLEDLEAWQTFVRSYPTGEAFRRYDEGWAVRLWSAEDKEYRNFLQPDITPHLDQLMTDLEAGQQDRLEREVAEAGPGSVRAVKDTAIFGTDRDMYVYGSGGAWKHIDVEDFVPRVRKIRQQTAPKSGSRSEFELVRAADVRTYQLLSAYWWVSRTGRHYADRHGGGEYLSLSPNTEALAYVDPDDLVTTVGTYFYERKAAERHPGIRPSAE